jgi:hypothetical protein
MSTPSEPPERRFTLDLRSGQIWPAGPRRPEPPVEDIPDEEWTEIGELNRVTGRSTLDIEKARRWRPIEEFWRWH